MITYFPAVRRELDAYAADYLEPVDADEFPVFGAGDLSELATDALDAWPNLPRLYDWTDDDGEAAWEIVIALRDRISERIRRVAEDTPGVAGRVLDVLAEHVAALEPDDESLARLVVAVETARERHAESMAEKIAQAG